MIPAFDLSRQNAAMRGEILSAVARVMDSGQFILGNVVQHFEESLSQWLEGGYVIGVANGSDALYLSLLALGIGHGDEVVTTPFTFFATAGSILRTGAKPVFSDVDMDTFNMDPAQAFAQVSPRTRAMLPVHLFGLMADVKALQKGFDGPIVEDAAQAIGACRNGQMATLAGTVGTLSFFPTKNLGAYGDAGAVVTTEPEIYEAVRVLRVHGSATKYVHQRLGINSRLDSVQAAVLQVKLAFVKKWTARRQEVAARYSQGLMGGGVKEVTVPRVPAHADHVFHQYTIRTDKRDELKQYLQQRGIGSTVYYPLPLHLQPALQDLGYGPGDFPVSEELSRTVLSLPMFPEISDAEIDQVIEAIASFYGHGRG